jgi:3',5'-cyclic AMP phosphodiesterase CpdA
MRRPRYRLVQISDTHLVADGRLFGVVDACARVEAAFEMLDAAGWRVDLVVLSGDLADRGEAPAYARLRSVLAQGLDRLEARVIVVPGNHDDVRLVRSILLGLDPGSGPLDSVVRLGGLRVIGLDSTVPGADYGELDDAQLSWLADELAEPAADGSILVVHHAPIWSTTPHAELMALHAPARLADTIRGTDIHLILSGHTHRVSAGTFAGIPVWVSPPTASFSDVLFASGFRGHAGGGITCVDVLEAGQVVTTHVPLTGRDEVFYQVVLDPLA